MTLQLTKKHNFDIVFDSQKLFRLILEAFSNPTRIVNIEQFSEKLFGDYPTFTALAMTLLDSEVSFHVCGNSELSDEIKSLTLVKQENIESADFIFICDTDDLTKVIENAKNSIKLRQD